MKQNNVSPFTLQHTSLNNNMKNPMPLTREQHYTPSFFDTLLCTEQHALDDDSVQKQSTDHSDYNHDPTLTNPPSFPHHEDDDDDDDFETLISKETNTHYRSHCGIILLPEGPRYDAVFWICKVSTFYGFTALTTVLAVNYFDRFTTSLTFQSHELDKKPHMIHLTAVACLSLAAKMEEFHKPRLLDLQVEEPMFLFEAKTIQRMELLVLSTLEWRMNPVTPISFFEIIVRRVGLKTHLHCEFLLRCQRVLLCVIADSRVLLYLPSTLASATIIHVLKEFESINATEYINQLMDFLKFSEERVNECYKLILELLALNQGIYNVCRKRKQPSEEPSSPRGAIDASFCSDSSNDSWTVASSVSDSLDPVFKRSKAQDSKDAIGFGSLLML